MNVFLVTWAPREGVSVDSAAYALNQYVDQVPYLTVEGIQTWVSPDGTLGVATAAHAEHQVCARYVAFEDDRFALYAGRPICWGPNGEADGSSPLDPRNYLSPSSSWADALGGRCTVVRWDGRSAMLEVFTDSLGTYPVYSIHENGTYWISNSAALLNSVAGGRSLNVPSLASFLACNWVLRGATRWEGITPLAPASVHCYRRDRAPDVQTRLTVESVFAEAGRGFDPHEAARVLVSTTRALGDWPGRPVRVHLSGGRDSRLVFAAALQGEFEFEAMTTAYPNQANYPDTGDVVVARSVAQRYDCAHVVSSPDRGLSVRESARLLGLASNGLVSLGTTGVVRGWEAGRMAVYLSGTAGEISRRGYVYPVDAASPVKVAKAIYNTFVGKVPRPIVNREAKHLIYQQLLGWIGEYMERGVALRDIPDAFYVFERLPNWGGPSHRVYDLVNDVTSPLWEPALLRHALSLPAADRGRELFHFQLLEVLSPGLSRIPFHGPDPRWPGHAETRSTRAQRYHVLWDRIARELRRRRQAVRGSAVHDPVLNEALLLGRECIPGLPNHPAWDVLDRKRVVRLLSRHAATFDPRRRRQLLDLVSVFAAESEPSPHKP